jgi:hypothetical protein
MPDKVEHMGKEVNVDSRRRGQFGTALLVPTTSNPLRRRERVGCAISEQYNLR